MKFLSNISDTSMMTEATDKRFVTDAEKAKLDSGVTGGGTRGSGIINFGTIPGGNYTTVTISDTNVSSNSAIYCFINGSTSDHTDMEHLIVQISLNTKNIIQGVSFDVVAFSELRFTGTFAFNYIII
jgi:hypothetical protein